MKQDIIDVCVVGYAAWMLIGTVALLHFQLERRDPVKGEWVLLAAILPILWAATLLCYLCAVGGRLLRGEGLRRKAKAPGDGASA